MAACGQKEETANLRGGEYTTVQDGTKITLNFAADQDRAYGKIVNNYNAPYEISGSKIKFGPAAATMMMGIDENAMRVEREYFQFLGDVNSYKIAGNELLLQASGGKKMIFEKMN